MWPQINSLSSVTWSLPKKEEKKTTIWKRNFWAICTANVSTDSKTIDYLILIFEKKTMVHSDAQTWFSLPSFPKFFTFSCASLPKVCLSILSTAFSPWKCNPENECRETKLRDPIWSSTTSLISCTSDLWEHSWSATLWQYRGIKQMKENSLARAEIRWAGGEWKEKKKQSKV